VQSEDSARHELCAKSKWRLRYPYPLIYGHHHLLLPPGFYHAFFLTPLRVIVKPVLWLVRDLDGLVGYHPLLPMPAGGLNNHPFPAMLLRLLDNHSLPAVLLGLIDHDNLVRPLSLSDEKPQPEPDCRPNHDLGAVTAEMDIVMTPTSNRRRGQQDQHYRHNDFNELFHDTSPYLGLYDP